MSINEHWNNAYTKTEKSKLGWFETEATPTLKLIEKLNLKKDVAILNVGAGTSTLVADLLKKGFTNIIVNDISNSAIELLKAELKSKKDLVKFVEDDLANPTLLNDLEIIDLWNDRAVLHFLTEQKDVETYFNLLKSKLKVGGYAILAEFDLEGAEKCCGLFVRRYNAEMLQNELGNDFDLIEKFNYDFINPNGDTRKYIYTLFKRMK